jgi:hypothetical protein
MVDIEKARQNKANLEDLLRLKRAERPDPEFWEHFDRELHQRMLQTLVKKDPWFVQLFRGLTGRVAQTMTIGAAAALVALFVVRPVLVESEKPGESHYASDSRSVAAPTETARTESVMQQPSDFDLATAAERDYRIEAISGRSDDADYTAEYSLDSFQVATYDSEAYTSDSASFALAGVATGLVY